MAAQTSYNLGFSKGIAGGLFDLSAHEIVTKQAEGPLTFGVGVVSGTNKGVDVTAPSSDSTIFDFEGVVVHNSVMTEMGMDGTVVIADKKTVGCLRHGKIWVKTAADAAPAYREQVYVIIEGKEAGLFTTSADTSSKVALNAYFLGVTDDGIANAEFFAGMAVADKTGGDS